MGLHQTKNFFRSEENYQQNEIVAYQMGEEICKQCIWQGLVVVVQLLSHVWHFVTPWTAECWASLYFIISQSLLISKIYDEVIQLDVKKPTNTLIENWPEDLNRYFPPWRNAVGQKIYEKMSTSLTTRKMKIKTTLRYHITSIRNIVVQLLSSIQLFETPMNSITRLTYPTLSPRVCPSSYPLNQWCYPTVSSSATFISFFLQPFPTSVSFPMSQMFTSRGQSFGASASVLPMNIQSLFL